MDAPRFASALRSSLLAAAIVLATPVSRGEDEALVTLNMRNADIGAVVQWIAESTGKRVVVDPRVRGQVTILSRDPMTPEEAFAVVITAINVYGYTAIEQNGTLQIVPQANLKTGSTQFLNALPLNEADLPVNQVIRVANLPADQLANTLRPLVAPQASLIALPSGNTLVVTDTASNVRRIAQLATELDRNASLDLDVVTLGHASAEDLAEVLRKLLGEKKVALQIATDARVNAIMLAGSPEMRERARELLRHLDQPDVVKGNLKVVYLHYLKASELLPILRGIIESAAAKEGGPKSPLTIEASDATNALVINAPPDRMLQIEEVIKKLDIRRAQVLVEAVIAEVDESVSRELGIEWKTAFDGEGVEAISRFSGGKVQVSSTALQTADRGLTLGYFKNGSLRALLRALELDTDTNILSTPSLVTLDNQEAEILVGSNVPLLSGSSVIPGQTVDPDTGKVTEQPNPFQTIERKDIGISLKLTPQINQGDAITLDLLQSVETLTDAATAQDVITNKRSLRTSVMLQDNDVLVLGGLIQNQFTDSVEKIPLLGDIPLLGRLFRHSTRSLDRRNLMVFIRARILTDLETAESETRERYDRMRELQQEYNEQAGKAPISLKDEAPQLPALEAPQAASE